MAKILIKNGQSGYLSKGYGYYNHTLIQLRPTEIA